MKRIEGNIDYIEMKTYVLIFSKCLRNGAISESATSEWISLINEKRIHLTRY